MSDKPYKVRILPLARDDMRDAKIYLSRFYPDTARKVLTELKTKINTLPEHPMIYESYPDDPFYRRMVVTNYNVYYHVDENQKVIEVHRILRGSWDIRQYLTEHR